MLKRYREFNTKNRIEPEKNGEQDGKVFQKLMNNALYGKTMENLKNKINVKLLNIEIDYLNCTSKPGYMSCKIFDNNLVLIRKTELALKLNKPACIEITY